MEKSNANENQEPKEPESPQPPEPAGPKPPEPVKSKATRLQETVDGQLTERQARHELIKSVINKRKQAQSVPMELSAPKQPEPSPTPQQPEPMFVPEPPQEPKPEIPDSADDVLSEIMRSRNQAVDLQQAEVDVFSDIAETLKQIKLCFDEANLRDELRWTFEQLLEK